MNLSDADGLFIEVVKVVGILVVLPALFLMYILYNFAWVRLVKLYAYMCPFIGGAIVAAVPTSR